VPFADGEVSTATDEEVRVIQGAEQITMSKYDIKPEGQDWDSLRNQLQDMQQQLRQPELNLVGFARLYEGTAKMILAAVDQTGLSSMRFEAAAKALDLGTRKSKLEKFLEE
jgi:hypothetical protein